MDELLHGRLPYELITSRRNRITFLYTEYAVIQKERNSLIIRQAGLDFDIPAAVLSCLMMGPGTSITQPAMNELSRMGCSIMSVASGGLGLYSGFVASSPKNARYAIKQAQIVSNPKERLRAAREMYSKRWGIPVSDLSRKSSIRELMRFEGQKVKDLYGDLSVKHDVSFSRNPNPEDKTTENNAINSALTNANHMLYGLCNSVILGLGASPALGIIHHGNSQSFAFDVSDFFKESITILFAFAYYDLTSKQQRGKLRDIFFEERVIEKSIDLMVDLLDDPEDVSTEPDPSGLWGRESVVWNQGRSA